MIQAYSIRVNPQRLGLMLPVCIRIRPVPGQLDKVEQMEALIDKLTPYAMTNTAIIQSSPVVNRLPAMRAT